MIDGYLDVADMKSFEIAVLLCGHPVRFQFFKDINRPQHLPLFVIELDNTSIYYPHRHQCGDTVGPAEAPAVPDQESVGHGGDVLDSKLLKRAEYQLANFVGPQCRLHFRIPPTWVEPQGRNGKSAIGYIGRICAVRVPF